MPDSDDSASSWPGLLGQLNKTFDLIRDILGYALPGAVFLSIGVIAKNAGCKDCGGFSLLQLQQVTNAIPFDVPVWALFLGLLAASYAAGNVLVATVYMVVGLAKYAVWMFYRHLYGRDVLNTTNQEVQIGHIWKKKIPANGAIRVSAWRTHALPLGVVLARPLLNASSEVINFRGKQIPAQATAWIPASDAHDLPAGLTTDEPLPREGSLQDWLISNPTEVSPRTLELQLKNRNVLNTLDRRETLTMMAGSMATALLGGYYAFYCHHWGFSQVILVGGCINVVQFMTGLSHLRRVLRAVHLAKVSDPPTGPDFPKLVSDLMSATTAALKKYTTPVARG